MNYLFKGIDVSRHNGAIDFKKVKASGIDFVIIRAGYGNSTSQKDARFETFYKDAVAAGLEVGAYWYSYATSVAEAEREARACLTILNNRKFSYPVYYDVEERSQLNQGRATVTNMINNFCKLIENNGYVSGLYTFYSALDKMNIPQIKCEKWLAKWSSNMGNCSPKDWALWQYAVMGNTSECTRSGSIPGMGYSSGIDLDYSYKDYTKITGISFASGVAKEVEKSNNTSIISKSQDTNNNESSSNIVIKAGNKIILNNTSIYTSSSVNKPYGTKTGTFYIYSSEIINKRVRITNSLANVGRLPIGSYVTGWINISSISSTQEVKEEVKPVETNIEEKYAAGKQIKLSNANLYISSSATKVIKRLTGTFYIYSSKIINNKIRITNKASNALKTPVGSYVTGWINVNDIK